MKKRVFFLCTGNSCRSQMAEGLLRHLAGDRYEVFSAGMNPSAVNPFAIEVMKEIGIDISKHRSKSVDEFSGAHFDYVITVCDNAKESCPNFPGSSRFHWNIEDPAEAAGMNAERIATFRKVKDSLIRSLRESGLLCMSEFTYTDIQAALMVHYAEIGLKKGNRSYFEESLVRNIRTALGSKFPCAIRKLPGRFAIFPQKDVEPDACMKKLTRVFGIASVANSTRVEPDIDVIRETILQLIDKKEFKSFAVRARRGDKTFPMNSQEVNVLIGAAVEKASGARVDLTSPELTIAIELMKNHAFIYTDIASGPGGLPVGASGRVVCLISGGIDSPVAAWKMMKRGCLVSFIHFHSEPFTTSDSQDKVVSIVEHLLNSQPSSTLTMVPFGEIQKKIVISVPKEYRVLMYRRFMIRIACMLAKQQGAKALVTGEALAQVASQTLDNMAAIEAISELPILRPLVGLDKEEIIKEAKNIGTFDISIQPHSDCCSFLTPRHPATRSTARELADVERALDVDALISSGLDGAVTNHISF